MALAKGWKQEACVPSSKSLNLSGPVSTQVQLHTRVAVKVKKGGACEVSDTAPGTKKVPEVTMDAVIGLVTSDPSLQWDDHPDLELGDSWCHLESPVPNTTTINCVISGS